MKFSPETEQQLAELDAANEPAPVAPPPPAPRPRRTPTATPKLWSAEEARAEEKARNLASWPNEPLGLMYARRALAAGDITQAEFDGVDRQWNGTVLLKLMEPHKYSPQLDTWGVREVAADLFARGEIDQEDLAVVASALADLELKKMEARERQTIAEYDAELAASEELERVGRLREQAEQVFAETYDRVFAVEPEDVPDQPDHAQPDAGEGGGQ